MKISEAIKIIVDQNDKKLLTDSKRFKSCLFDLCSDNPKELKIVKRALEDEILERIFGNERDNVKIARLRDEFEDQGMTTDWSEFVISSFAEALAWNYTQKYKINKCSKISLQIRRIGLVLVAVLIMEIFVAIVENLNQFQKMQVGLVFVGI